MVGKQHAKIGKLNDLAFHRLVDHARSCFMGDDDVFTPLELLITWYCREHGCDVPDLRTMPGEH